MNHEHLMLMKTLDALCEIVKFTEHSDSEVYMVVKDAEIKLRSILHQRVERDKKEFLRKQGLIDG